jgi:hypothetical protein
VGKQQQQCNNHMTESNKIYDFSFIGFDSADAGMSPGMKIPIYYQFADSGGLCSLK